MYKLDYQSQNSSKFIPMPPPNITGKLHMGHALFLSIQDSLNRFYLSTHQKSLWLAGLDHAGLATYEKIIQYMENNACDDYETATKYIESTHSQIILKQIQQIGAIPYSWDENNTPYIYTLNSIYQQFTLEVLNCLKEDGLIQYIPSRDTNEPDNFALNINILAQELLMDIDNGLISITPKKEIGKLRNFLINIEEWNISRDISWGTKFPYDEQLNKIETSNKSLDTWFNSSLYPIASLLTMWHDDMGDIKQQYGSFQDLLDEYYPAELIETGADILFFWCAKMLMMCNYIYQNQDRISLLSNCKIKQKYPFYKIYLHGLIRDKQNRKFSKSLGNGIDPLDLIDEYKQQYPIQDGVRWTLMTKTGAAEDMKFSTNDNQLFSSFKLMNKIWNAGRFFYGYCEQNNYQFNMENLNPIKNDDYDKIQNIMEQFVTNMNNFNFLITAKDLEHQFKSWFCDIWIEENKKQIQNGDNIVLQQGMYIYLQFIIMFSCFCPFMTDIILSDLYPLPKT